MRPLAVLLAAAVLNAGCATMWAGAKQQVAFTSDPPGAKVDVVTGQKWPLQCLTPCTLIIPRGAKPLAYSAEMPTREPFTGELIATPNFDLPAVVSIGSVLGAFLIVPGIVDLATHALYMWPNAAAFTLPPQGQGGARVVLKR